MGAKLRFTVLGPRQAELDRLEAKWRKDMPSGADRRRMAELLHSNDVPWYLGAAGGVSVPTCKYLQGAELADTSEKKVDFSGSVQAGLFTPTLGFLIGMMGYQQTSVPGAAHSRRPPYQRC